MLRKKLDLEVHLTGMTEFQMFREENKLEVLENYMFEFQLIRLILIRKASKEHVVALVTFKLIFF